MNCKTHFEQTDELIKHLDSVMAGVKEPFIESRYVGFISVCAVTVFELAVKNIFCDFAANKNAAFGIYCQSTFARLNGRIALGDLKHCLSKFGPVYRERFEQDLNVLEECFRKKYKKSIVTSYSNLITWRNSFAHEGKVSAYATYAEVCMSYKVSKLLIRKLSKIMC